MSQHEIVPGGPTREEAQELNKPTPKSFVPKLGVWDKISFVLTGLGLGALGNTALEAQNQTQKPPQTTPDQRGPNLPPEGVRLDALASPTGGPVPDAPVEPVYSHKLLLPNVTNKASDTLVLTAEQQLERFIERTQVVDRVEQVRNNKTYSVETRVVPAASLKVTVKPELKNEVARLVAQDGEKNGFTKAEIVVTKLSSEIPTTGRREIAPGVAVRYRSDIWDYNTQQYIPVGYWTVQQRNNTLTFFFAPDNNLPLDNQEFMVRANRDITDKFFRMTISGGDPLANVANTYRENPEYLDLINKTTFFFVSS